MKLKTPDISEYVLLKPKRIKTIKMINNFDNIKQRITLDDSNTIVVEIMEKE